MLCVGFLETMAVKQLLLSLLVLSLLLLSESANECRIPLKSKCQCIELSVEQEASAKVPGLRVEFSETSAEDLHQDINELYNNYSPDPLQKTPIYVIQVRNSNLRGLRVLPSGLDQVRHMILDNTGIDLEAIRGSNELLQDLRSLRVYNESFTEVPENFFHGMPALSLLELNDIGIVAISEDAFGYLEDSLKELQLRENKLTRIPIAIQSLSRLERLDLVGNEISLISNDMTKRLESNLRSLNYLFMDKINCTCEFGDTLFVSWIRSHAIKGVTCFLPKRLLGKDVSTTPTEDFCNSSPSGARLHPLLSLLIYLCLIKSVNL